MVPALSVEDGAEMITYEAEERWAPKRVNAFNEMNIKHGQTQRHVSC
jgi:hypothetical protein